MKRNHICIAFHEVTKVLASDRVLGLEEAIQHVTLVIDLRLRRVDIFRLVSCLIFRKYARTKRDDFASKIVNWKDHSSAKAVVFLTIVLLDKQAGFLKHILAVSFLDGRFREIVPLIQRVTEFELLDSTIIESSFAEITQTNTSPLFVFEQQLVVVVP